MVEEALGALRRIKTLTILRSVPIVLVTFGGHWLLSPDSEAPEAFLLGALAVGLGVFLCRALFRVETPEEVLEEALKWVRAVGITVALVSVADFGDRAFGWREHPWTAYVQALLGFAYGVLVSARAFPLRGR